MGTQIQETKFVKVIYNVERHGHLVQVCKLVKERVLVQTYKCVKEVMMATVGKYLLVFNPNG